MEFEKNIYLKSQITQTDKSVFAHSEIRNVDVHMTQRKSTFN